MLRKLLYIGFAKHKKSSSMTVNVLAFGIAKDILGSRQLRVELSDTATVGQLKARLCEQYPAFEQLASLSIALNTAYAKDEAHIQASDEVVIIPPVSGG